MTERHRSVLVVDDDDDIRELLALVLGARGYEVAGAGDGMRALAHLKGHPPPDLVLLDLMMPHLAGDDLVSLLREDPALSDVPVVILSGDGAACERAASLPVQGCLLKPVNLRDLLSTVERFADGHARS